MSNPFQVVKDFEAALCEYTGAPFAVTTTSCTDALKLAVAWHLREYRKACLDVESSGPAWASFVGLDEAYRRFDIEIPKRTYAGVPMAIIHAGGRPTFREQSWLGWYDLRPLPVWDSARWFTGGMYRGAAKMVFDYGLEIVDMTGQMVCVSFHWSKTLGIQQGGAILHDDPAADSWLRMARFDGREEGVAPKDQKEWIVGHHCYMAPETAAAGLVRLRNLPLHNEPLPNDEYPDLSQLDIFK